MAFSLKLDVNVLAQRLNQAIDIAAVCFIYMTVGKNLTYSYPTDLMGKCFKSETKCKKKRLQSKQCILVYHVVNTFLTKQPTNIYRRIKSVPASVA